MLSFEYYELLVLSLRCSAEEDAKLITECVIMMRSALPWQYSFLTRKPKVLFGLLRNRVLFDWLWVKLFMYMRSNGTCRSHALCSRDLTFVMLKVNGKQPDLVHSISGYLRNWARNCEARALNNKKLDHLASVPREESFLRLILHRTLGRENTIFDQVPPFRLLAFLPRIFMHDFPPSPLAEPQIVG